MIGRIVKPRVYLEGLEVPAYRVTIQTSIGAPAAAIIELPPKEEFFDRYVEEPEDSGNYVQKSGILPRTLVHIAYEDSQDPDGALRLLFEGEFVKFEYEKTVENRVVKLIAKDVNNILSSVYTRYYRDFASPYSNLLSAFAGVGTQNNPDTKSLALSIVGTSVGNGAEIIKAITDDVGGFGVADAFRRIFNEALQVNAFFSQFAARTKIDKKIVSLIDENSGRLLDFNVLASLAQQNMSNLREGATIWDLYNMLMSLVFYVPVPIVAPPFYKNRITDTGPAAQGSQTFEVSPGNTTMSLLMKPYTWWSTPANFNVIFPSQYKSFSMSRDFMSEPTRLIMSAFGVIEALVAQNLQNISPSQFTFIAPDQLKDKFDQERFDTDASTTSSPTISQAVKDLQKLINERNAIEVSLSRQSIPASEQNSLLQDLSSKNQEISEKETEIATLSSQAADAADQELAAEASVAPREVSVNFWNKSIMSKSDGVSLASREDLKGIVFAFDYLSQAQADVSKTRGISPIALKNYLSRVANYKLALSQHKNRFATIQCEFMPQLVAGFPGLVVDPNRNFFGEIDTVTHVFDANGLADTQVVMSFTRSDEMEFGEASRNDPGAVEFPDWINEKYRPENIGEQVYQVLFPENKPFPNTPGIPAAKAIAPAFGENQVKAGRELRKRYYNAKDPSRFALAFTRRNIATLDQAIVDALGGAKVGRNFAVTGTSDERFQAVNAYVSSLTPGVIVQSDSVSEEVRNSPEPPVEPEPRSETLEKLERLLKDEIGDFFIPEDIPAEDPLPSQRIADARNDTALENAMVDVSNEIRSFRGVAALLSEPDVVSQPILTRLERVPPGLSVLKIDHQNTGLKINITAVVLRDGTASGEGILSITKTGGLERVFRVETSQPKPESEKPVSTRHAELIIAVNRLIVRKARSLSATAV